MFDYHYNRTNQLTALDSRHSAWMFSLPVLLCSKLDFNILYRTLLSLT